MSRYDQSNFLRPEKPKFTASETVASHTVTGFNWRGQYAEFEQYHKDDVVRYAGSAFIALKTTKGNQPSVRHVQGFDGLNDDAFWDIVTVQGDSGPNGPQGEAGPTGEQGPKGDTGDTGPKGDTGATGAKGDQGVQGVKGDTGDTGPTGATGAKGDQGDQGNPGPGVAVGGAAGQMLVKNTSMDYDTTWATPVSLPQVMARAAIGY